MSKYINASKVFFHGTEFDAYKSGAPLNPISVELHISNKCNNNCYYCGQTGNRDGKTMSADEIKHAIDFIYNIGAKSLYFSGGGEPTVNKNFNDAIVYARSTNLDVGVITNALSSKIDTKELVTCCKWVRVSIDSSTDSMYYKIRGCHGYENVRSNIVSMLRDRDKSCVIGLQVIPNKYNFMHIYNITKSLLHQFPNIDYIQVRPIETTLNERPYSRFQLSVISVQLSALRSVPKVIISDKWNTMHGKQRTFGFNTCHSAYFTGTIDAHGDYYLCCHMIHNTAYKFGNVFTMKPKDFYTNMNNAVKSLSNQGFNAKLCPVGCRGSVINQSISKIISDPHKNFV